MEKDSGKVLCGFRERNAFVVLDPKRGPPTAEWFIKMRTVEVYTDPKLTSISRHAQDPVKQILI
jgi:hypothetical protein